MCSCSSAVRPVRSNSESTEVAGAELLRGWTGGGGWLSGPREDGRLPGDFVDKSIGDGVRDTRRLCVEEGGDDW